MNLPHLPPIRFAQEVLEVTQTTAKVKLCFPFKPTLGMFIEAAAQSSAAFSNETPKIGFIVALKEVKLLRTSTQLDMIAHLLIETLVGELIEISFNIVDQKEQESFSTGRIILKMESTS